MFDDMERYDNVSFRIETPDGTATIIIAEESDGKLYKIFFEIGKAGTSVKAWAFAVCELATEMIRSGTEVHKVVELLSNISSSRPIYDREGVPCRSGVEALVLALTRWDRFKKDKHSKVKFREDYRPSRMGG